MQEILQAIQDTHIFYQFVAIFIIAFIPFFEVLPAIPIGALLNLPIIPTIIIGVIANFISVMLVVVFSSYVKSKFSKNKQGHFVNKRFEKAKKYFNKYGVPGISLLGPFFGISHIGAIVCILADADKKKLMLWQFASIVLWAVGMGVLVTFGVNIFKNVM